MKLKNYVKEGQKLPLFGIGPYLIYGMAVLNIIVLILAGYIFKSGILEGVLIHVCRISGAVLIILGVAIWVIGALRSGMDKNITENRLKTDGIYAWLRNPMYTGLWFFMSGIGLMWHNVWLVMMILVDWIIMTVVLINTEEKWLLDLYGEEYAEYKKRVNRFIPWKSGVQQTQKR